MKNKCDKGKPCGNGCIEKIDNCQQTANKEAAASLDAAAIAAIKPISLSSSAKLIASGNYGNIYLQGDAIIKESKELGKGIGANEASIQAKAAKLGTAPEILSSTENTLAMEAWKSSDGWRAGKNFKPIKSINDAERKSITEQLQTLHANGIAQGDLHSGNIFINRKTGRTGIIDYGLSVEKSDEQFLTKLMQDIGKGGAAISGFAEGSPLAKVHAVFKANKSSTNAGKLARFAAAQQYLLALEG